MNINDINRKIFIHIPKNGGMTIRHPTSILRSNIIIPRQNTLISNDYLTAFTKRMKEVKQPNIPAEHARWRDLNLSLRSAHQSFAIVRNPWDRVVSRYMFKAIQTPGYLENTPFEKFLEERHEFVGEARSFTWHLAVKGWFPAYDYVTDNNGNIQCDIIRFGHMNEDICKYFNLVKGTKLYIRNVSNGEKSENKTTVVNRKPYQEFYNDKTIQIVADWYKDDINTWGFDFDSEATKNYWNKEN